MARNRTEAIKLATPPWSGVGDRLLIKDLQRLARLISTLTGIRHVVDHIIPILGENVCGLNIPANLRVIVEEDNLKKSNHLVADLALPGCVLCVLSLPLPYKQLFVVQHEPE